MRQYADGACYIGSWLDDKKHGHGTFTFPDGSKYEGEFKNGEDGAGVFTDVTGVTRKGNWSEGDFTQWKD